MAIPQRGLCGLGLTQVSKQVAPKEKSPPSFGFLWKALKTCLPFSTQEQWVDANFQINDAKGLPTCAHFWPPHRGDKPTADFLKRLLPEGVVQLPLGGLGFGFLSLERMCPVGGLWFFQARSSGCTSILPQVTVLAPKRRVARWGNGRQHPVLARVLWLLAVGCRLFGACGTGWGAWKQAGGSPENWEASKRLRKTAGGFAFSFTLSTLYWFYGSRHPSMRSSARNQGPLFSTLWANGRPQQNPPNRAPDQKEGPWGNGSRLQSGPDSWAST